MVNEGSKWLRVRRERGGGQYRLKTISFDVGSLMVMKDYENEEWAWAVHWRMVKGSFRRKAVPPPSMQLFLEIEEGLVREAESNQMVLQR